jgi:hypothetical protein
MFEPLTAAFLSVIDPLPMEQAVGKIRGMGELMCAPEGEVVAAVERYTNIRARKTCHALTGPIAPADSDYARALRAGCSARLVLHPVTGEVVLEWSAPAETSAKSNVNGKKTGYNVYCDGKLVQGPLSVFLRNSLPEGHPVLKRLAEKTPEGDKGGKEGAWDCLQRAGDPELVARFRREPK